MSHVSEFFRGYPTVTEGAAALRYGTQLIASGDYATQLQEAAATAHVIEGSILSFWPGAPTEVFTAGRSSKAVSDKIAETAEGNDLLAAMDEFDDAMQSHGDSMQMAQPTEGLTADAKMSPAALIQLFLTIWELIKKIRT